MRTAAVIPLNLWALGRQKLTRLALLLGFAATSFASNLVEPPNYRFQFFGKDGIPLKSARVYIYRANSSTLLESFTDSTRRRPNPNPIVLDAFGQASIWLSEQPFRIHVRDDKGNVVWNVDAVKDIAELSQPAERVKSGEGPSVTRVLSVLDYGCSIDGQVAVNSCITSAASVITGKDKLFFPAGRYLVDNTKGWLQIEKFSGWMDFAPGATIVCQDNSRGCLRWLGGSNIIVSGLTAEYKVPAPKRIGEVFVFFDGSTNIGGCTNVVVERYTSRGSGAAGLNFYYCNSVKASDIRISSSRADGLAVNNTSNFVGDHIVTEDTGDDAVNCINYTGGAQGRGCTISDINVNKTKSACIAIGGYRDVVIHDFICDHAIGSSGQNAVIDVRDGSPSVAMGSEGFSISDGRINNSIATYGIRVMSNPKSTGRVQGSFSNIELNNIYFDFSDGYAVGTDDNNTSNRTLEYRNITIKKVQVGSPRASLPAAGLRVAAASATIQNVNVTSTTGPCIILKDFVQVKVEKVTARDCARSIDSDKEPVIVKPSSEAVASTRDSSIEAIMKNIQVVKK